jgi:hypothetical protein
MSVQPDLTKDVLEHRSISHLRLLELLKRAGIGDSTDMVEWVVFDYHHTRFTNFFAQMAEMFAFGSIRCRQVRGKARNT